MKITRKVINIKAHKFPERRWSLKLKTKIRAINILCFLQYSTGIFQEHEDFLFVCVCSFLFCNNINICNTIFLMEKILCMLFHSFKVWFY